MKIAIMQPYFFPYIGYFQLIQSVEKFILYDQVTYRKASWMNRNRIINYSNKEVAYMGYPIRKYNFGSKINEVRIDETSGWRKYLLKFLMHNYKRSKNFDSVYPLVQSIINYPSDQVSQFNNNLVKSICSFLNIRTQIEDDNELYQRVELQLTNNEHSPIEQKLARIITICQLSKANHYVNPIGGVELYDKEDFFRYGIQLLFLQSQVIKYNQFGQDFKPHLSILDVLFHCGKEEVKKQLTSYELV